ncbi:hypothetical protein PSAC2689_10488 [Paraburkholderia sacchari]
MTSESSPCPGIVYRLPLAALPTSEGLLVALALKLQLAGADPKL